MHTNASNSFIDWVYSTWQRVGRPSTDEFVVDCPHCGAKGRLSLNPSKRLYHCYKCGGGKLTDWLADWLKISSSEAYKVIDGDSRAPESPWAQQVTVEQGNPSQAYADAAQNFVPIWADNIVMQKLAWPFLASRGFTIEYASSWRLLFATAGRWVNRIILPVYNQANQLVYWQGRDVLGQGKDRRYMNPGSSDGLDKTHYVFGLDVVAAAKSKVVYVCEGAFTAMSIGPNACAIFGKEISEHQVNAILSATEAAAAVVVAYDYGTTLGAIEAAAMFAPYRQTYLLLRSTEDDYNDLLVKQGAGAVQQALANLKLYSYDLSVWAAAQPRNRK